MPIFLKPNQTRIQNGLFSWLGARFCLLPDLMPNKPKGYMLPSSCVGNNVFTSGKLNILQYLNTAVCFFYTYNTLVCATDISIGYKYHPSNAFTLLLV